MIWNAVLNLVLYFSLNSKTDILFFNFTIGYSLGGLLAFLIQPLLFSKLKNVTTIYLSLFLNMICFYLVMYLVTVDYD